MTTPAFPVQLKLQTKDDFQYARNFLGYLFKHHGNEALIMWVDHKFQPDAQTSSWPS